MGEGVKIGERVRLKVKGPVILEIDKTCYQILLF